MTNELPINCASALLAGERAYFPSPSGGELARGQIEGGGAFPFYDKSIGVYK